MATHKAVQMDVTVATHDLHVDSDGNLVIKNKELAHKVQEFLASDEGLKLEAKEYYLLCCKLRPPTL
jgi:hypothetical protein